LLTSIILASTSKLQHINIASVHLDLDAYEACIHIHII